MVAPQDTHPRPIGPNKLREDQVYEELFMQLRLSFWQFCSVRPAWPRLAKENARKIIAGSAANGGLRLAAYRIACARMAIGCPMRASED